jgi:hypothetical protein
MGSALVTVLAIEISVTHHKIGVLSARHFVVENARVGGSHIRLKATIEYSDLAPVEVECLYILITYSSAQFRLLESHADCSH